MNEATPGSSPRPTLVDDAGELLPARIELVESSGPVSPRYQYATRVLISVEPASVPRLAFDHAANYTGGVPAIDAHGNEPLARERYERLWSDLFAQEVFSLGGDLVADRRDRTGVSFNHVEVVLGDPEHDPARMRFDYLLPQLQDSANERRLAVVEILKSFVPQAPAKS